MTVHYTVHVNTCVSPTYGVRDAPVLALVSFDAERDLTLDELQAKCFHVVKEAQAKDRTRSINICNRVAKMEHKPTPEEWILFWSLGGSFDNL